MSSDVLNVHDQFEADLEKFSRLGGKIDEELRCFDSGDKYPVDFQYILMDRWAYDRIRTMPRRVSDFGSKIDFLAIVASSHQVTHYDIRQPDIEIPGLEFKRGNLTSIPEGNDSLFLVSSLHVAEHVGLGRYGDEVDPDGFKKSCAELSRVLAPGGSLLFAVPIGRPRVVFNAHRVLPTKQVIDAFPDLKLCEFSGISSQGKFVENAPIGSLDFDRYGCGLFHFKKETVNA